MPEEMTPPDTHLDSASASDHVRQQRDVVALRGAEAVAVGTRVRFVAGVIGLIVVAAVLVVSFLSVSNDHARIERMKAHGIAVSVTVSNCTGNIGGSGSNGAGFTCRGSYAVGTTTFHERIGSKTTFSAPGTAVEGVVDPSHHGTVVLASAVRASKASYWGYAPLTLLTLVFVALVYLFVRASRRKSSPDVKPLDDATNAS
jgi:hypothetical protein